MEKYTLIFNVVNMIVTGVMVPLLIGANKIPIKKKNHKKKKKNHNAAKKQK